MASEVKFSSCATDDVLTNPLNFPRQTKIFHQRKKLYVSSSYLPVVFQTHAEILCKGNLECVCVGGGGRGGGNMYCNRQDGIRQGGRHKYSQISIPCTLLHQPWTKRASLCCIYETFFSTTP